MKKNWYIMIFCLTMVYYVIYYIAFWYIFDDNDIYTQYFWAWYDIFWFMFIPNILCQSIAIMKKRKLAGCLLLLGMFAGIFTHGITVASGV